MPHRKHGLAALAAQWCLAGLLILAAAHLTCPAPRSSGAGDYRYAGNFSHFSERGKLLLHGVRDPGLTFSMPLVGAAAAALPGGPSAPALNWTAFALQAGIYLACFLIAAGSGGALCGGAAVLAALAANLALGGNYEIEQLFFTFFLLLFMKLLLLRSERRGRLWDAAAGLAAGFTLLVRPVLFLFPPLEAWRQRMGRRRAAALLIASYALLLPWTAINYSLLDKLSPFEPDRAACNVITGVLGSVYTAEGDCRALAGLAPGESVYGWAAARIAAAPAAYLVSVLKRLLHIFYQFPALFLLGLAGFLLRRDSEARTLGALALYFVLMHSLMSIEPRYFYPLRAPLVLLAVRGLWRFAPAGRAGTGALAPAILFGLAALPVLALELLLLAYPFRMTPPPAAYDRALKTFPRSAWLWEKKGDWLFRSGETAAGLEAYGRAYEASGGGDRRLGYILMTLTAPSAAEVPAPADYGGGLETPELLALKAARELELGDKRRAAASLAAAYQAWRASSLLLRGTPYETDRAVKAKIEEGAGDFWKTAAPAALVYWPPGKREALLAGLKKLAPPGSVPGAK